MVYRPAQAPLGRFSTETVTTMRNVITSVLVHIERKSGAVPTLSCGNRGRRERGTYSIQTFVVGTVEEGREELVQFKLLLLIFLS